MSQDDNRPQNERANTKHDDDAKQQKNASKLPKVKPANMTAMWQTLKPKSSAIAVQLR